MSEGNKEATKDGETRIKERTELLIEEGCDPTLAHMVSTVAELYRACLIAAHDVMSEEGLAPSIYRDEKRTDAAAAIMSGISVSFKPVGGLVQATAMPDIISGTPPGFGGRK